MNSITQPNSAEKLSGLLSDLNNLNDEIRRMDEQNERGELDFNGKLKLWSLNTRWINLTGEINSLVGLNRSVIL